MPIAKRGSQGMPHNRGSAAHIGTDIGLAHLGKEGLTQIFEGEVGEAFRRVRESNFAMGG